MRRKVLVVILAVVVAASIVVMLILRDRPQAIVLTGIVTANEFDVSSQISGQLAQVLVRDGDPVRKGELLALIAPAELRASQAYYASSMRSTGAQVGAAEAALSYQELQTRDQIKQAEATLAATEAQRQQAEANLSLARSNFNRTDSLFKQGIVSGQSEDQARADLESAKANVESLIKQVAAQRAALALAKSNEEQIRMRERQLASNRQQLAAAKAQDTVAKVRLGYTEIRSPINGVVELRAALPGEVVNPGQAIVVLYDPNQIWVRADMPETYIDRVKMGERLPVRFPDGTRIKGTVYFRGVDADYATQRDVSRTKRDIKTFEIRLHVDNRGNRFPLGITAYVTVPIHEED